MLGLLAPLVSMFIPQVQQAQQSVSNAAQQATSAATGGMLDGGKQSAIDY